MNYTQNLGQSEQAAGSSAQRAAADLAAIPRLTERELEQLAKKVFELLRAELRQTRERWG